jgi:iron complex transport system ATP-binding protein
MLEVRDLHFSYSQPVLKGVSFDAGEGELLAILGPNGSGKSTLVKLILRLLALQKGSVNLSGRNIASMSRREIAAMAGYVAQETVVRFPLTTMEYVLQGRFAQGRLIGFESEQDLLEARRAMELTETVDFASRPIMELSGGERQRVMLARALASRPKLLVLDEPVANLDIAHQIKMFDLVRRLTRERELTAVVVTHELNLAAEFATKVLMLKSGEMLACGPPGEVITEDVLQALFDTELMVDKNPVTGAPRITPIAPKKQWSVVSGQLPVISA